MNRTEFCQLCHAVPRSEILAYGFCSRCRLRLKSLMRGGFFRVRWAAMALVPSAALAALAWVPQALEWPPALAWAWGIAFAFLSVLNILYSLSLRGRYRLVLRLLSW